MHDLRLTLYHGGSQDDCNSFGLDITAGAMYCSEAFFSRTTGVDPSKFRRDYPPLRIRFVLRMGGKGSKENLV